jgi:hypothetical protein
MAALIGEFAASGYRPAALEKLVTPEAAKARWQALEKFVAEKNHLLATNGPYRLSKWSPGSFVFDVVRDFSYPIGLGTFNAYAYPPNAIITSMGRDGRRVLLSVDVELALKEMRNHRIVRKPLMRGTLRDTLAIRPVTRYVLVAGNGTVMAAGAARREADGRFAVTLPETLAAGNYTVFVAIFLDGNTINPAIGRMDIRQN